jgi:hypothetical protein
MHKLDPDRYVILNMEVKGQLARFAVPRHWPCFYAARFAWDALQGDSGMSQHFGLETSDGRYISAQTTIGWTFIDDQFVRVVERREELA